MVHATIETLMAKHPLLELRQLDYSFSSFESGKNRKPNIIFLSEIKISAGSIMPITLLLGFQNSHIILSCNKARGLALLLNSYVTINIITSYMYLINTIATYVPGNHSWKASFFYGSPYSNTKPKAGTFLLSNAYHLHLYGSL